eukprot:489723_1
MYFNTSTKLTFTLVILSYISIVLANINCVNRKSNISASNNDAKAYIGCNMGETLVSCGVEMFISSDAYVDGSFVEYILNENICVAVNGHFGQGIYGWARCCTFSHTIVDCESQTGPNKYSDGSVSISYCPPSYPYLLGCSATSGYHAIDGSYPDHLRPDDSAIVYNTDYKMTSNNCTMMIGNGDSNDNGQAESLCCASNQYAIECVKRFGSPSNSISTVSCSNEYFMSSCSGWSTQWNVNAWYIDDNNICNARSRDGNNVWSIALCCKIETDAPTNDPTVDPTTYPTHNPSH